MKKLIKIVLLLTISLISVQAFALPPDWKPQPYLQHKPGWYPYPWQYGGGPHSRQHINWIIWCQIQDMRLEEEARQRARDAERQKIEADAQKEKYQAIKDLNDLYANFSTLSIHTLQEAEDFISGATAGITKCICCSKCKKLIWFPFAKSHFTRETRIAFKIIYAIVIFIVNSDADGRTYLVSQGFTQAELDSMTVNISQSPAMAVSAPASYLMASSSSSSGSSGKIPLSIILSKHIAF